MFGLTRLLQKARSLARPRIEGVESDASAVHAVDQRPWIGVDLDGTLARDDLRMFGRSIGKPVEPMLRRVLQWRADGLRVKIMTARASDPSLIPDVQRWLEKHGIGGLEVTNAKDFLMVELWDDRAIQVVANTGQPVLGRSAATLPRAPFESISEEVSWEAASTPEADSRGA